MRVGLVCPYDLGKPGGVQAQVLGLADRLREGGDDVAVIGPGLPDEVDGIDLGPSLSLPGNRSRVPVSPDPRVGKAIASAATEVDVFHVHEPLMPFVSLAALRVGVPVVATFHAAPGSVGRSLYVVISSQLDRVLGSNVRRVTAVSATAAAPLPARLDVRIIPNGVDVASFRSEVERVPARVTFLGRDEPRKGLDVLLEAWPSIVSRVPAAELVVMGADRGEPGISWMGQVGEEEKKTTLGSSSVHVSPNLGGESFGIVLVEAMAAGAAVVASDLAAFRDVAGDTAVYFPPGDASALADTLGALLEDQEETSSRGRAGRERAVEYDWSGVAASYHEEYEKALS